jgi:sterol 14-demethylase
MLVELCECRDIPHSVFGTDVVYDCPNHLLMEQKRFVKFGLSTDNFKRYVGMIAEEVRHQVQHDIIGTHDAFVVSSEITICTASATLQGKEVRSSLNKSFAKIYEDRACHPAGITPANCS